MYLFFDKNGVLLEQVMNDAVRRNSVNYNHIYVYIDQGNGTHILDSTLQVLGATYALMNSTDDNSFQYLNAGDNISQSGRLTHEYLVNTKITKQIPYSKSRDLIHFKYGVDYEFFDILIPNEVTSFSGIVGLTLRAIYNSIDSNNNGEIDDNEILSTTRMKTLGLVVFHIEVGSGLSIENQMTESEYNYLIAFVIERTGGGGYDGFVPKRLSTFPDVSSNRLVSNNAWCYVDNNGVNAKISLRTIKEVNTKILTVDSVESADASNLIVGDYIFEKGD